MGTRTLLGVLTATIVAGYAVNASAIDMKIGFATVNDPQQAVANEIAKRINANKDMDVHVRTFPAGQIGTIPRMIEGLQFGTLEVMITPPGFLTGINKGFEVLDAPGMFKNVEVAHKAMNDPAFYSKYSKLAASKGIKMEALYVYGPQDWASKSPIRKLADFKGVKVRVLATKVESAIAAAVGATGVPMPYTQVLPALQRGTIDACRSSIIVMGGSKFFTVTKFITITEGGMIPSAVLVSEAWLKKLSAKQRPFVESTLQAMGEFGTKTAIEYGKKAEKLWKDNGAEVIHLSAADQKEYMAKIAPLGDKILGTDSRTKELYGILKQAVARAEKM